MPAFLITCPHATCAIPEAQRELFKGSEELVTSPQGWDPGSLNLAQGLSIKFRTPLLHGDVSRLLIDLEQENEKCWSKISAKIPENTRTRLAERHLLTFRNHIEQRTIEDLKRHKIVLHLMIHTSPLADGEIIIEHSPSDISGKFANNIAKLLPSNEVSCHCRLFQSPSPLVKWLLELFPDEDHCLIRLNVSQSFFLKSLPMRWETIKKAIINAIDNASQSI